MLFFLLLSHVIVITVSVNQGYITELTLPNAGSHFGAAKPQHYRTVTDLDLSDKHYLTFAVKAGKDAGLLLSDKPADSLNYDTDHGYSEICLGESGKLFNIIDHAAFMKQGV